ncbi:acyltransferase-domain-containing protein [Scheffersomyces amazonensis]|uniref:acyltransferase-domain-containing protein n=1 Tax=Scheffersomyces amazonensis TaxID=1078765 RepID=UPI00315C8A23
MSKIPKTAVQSLPKSIIKASIFFPSFLLGCLSIVATQLVGVFLFASDPSTVQNFICLSKLHFIRLITFATSFSSSADISITYDTALLPSSNTFTVDNQGNIHSNFSPNSVFISNHQIYTDWMFLWFLNYTSKLGQYVFIVLKDQLSKLPVLGYGMKNYNFLFLSRKWEQDKVVIAKQLKMIDADAQGVGPSNGVKNKNDRPINNTVFPYQLILYPEGTVPSDRTTKKSLEYTQFKKLPPLKHVLLPRTRGLFLVLRNLKDTVEVLYDITTGYSDLRTDEYGEDKFTLKNHYIWGQGPPKINYHIKSYRISEIPLGDLSVDIDDVKEVELQAFEDWLLKVWYEKDARMEAFFRNGSFTDPINPITTEKTVEGKLQLRNTFEVLTIFTTVGVVFSLLFVLLYVLKLFLF